MTERVVVIGGGAAGFSAALELTGRGYQVILIEKSTLGSGSSGKNPGRQGHGFHYIDIETAIMYLRASIKVQQKYPNYLIGKDRPFKDPLRHGRYFITKDSNIDQASILKVYQGIQDEYCRLIREDPANEVFGPPKDFFRILEPSEYEGQVNTDIVLLGVETAEHLFNWTPFIRDIKKQIDNNPNITLSENTEVIRIERGKLDEERFTIHVRKTDTGIETYEEIKTDYLVNSTWQNIERFNDQVGISMVPGSRTNRLKALLTVKLPEALLQANSMFFGMGQHCMFSNLGNGYGMMTFANETNMETSYGLYLSDHANRLLEGKAAKSEKDTIAQKMLMGVAKYIPAMANASIVDVQFGIVRTAGTLVLSDLNNPQHGVHKRDYYDVEEKQVGLISNPCIKLFYFVDNGRLVADLIDKQVIATSLIKEGMHAIKQQAAAAELPLNTDIKKTIIGTMERTINSMSVNSQFMEESATMMFQTLLHKSKVTNQLKAMGPDNVLRSLKPVSYSPNLTDIESISPSFFMRVMTHTATKYIALVLLALSLATFVAAMVVASTPVAITGGVTAGIAISLYAGSLFYTRNKSNSEPLGNRTNDINPINPLGSVNLTN